ncbi:MAG: heme exporter protein CcmD [Eggerthellaceae bacterium]|nr:heme exporter protein CcmD [Eggerthellaceae bacterium]
MNPILQEIYSTIIPSAPFIIAAYALVLVCLFVFLFMQRAKIRAAERRLDVLEDAVRTKAPERE